MNLRKADSDSLLIDVEALGTVSPVVRIQVRLDGGEKKTEALEAENKALRLEVAVLRTKLSGQSRGGIARTKVLLNTFAAHEARGPIIDHPPPEALVGFDAVVNEGVKLTDWSVSLFSCLADKPLLFDVLCCCPCQYGRQITAFYNGKANTLDTEECFFSIFLCMLPSMSPSFVSNLRRMIVLRYNIDESPYSSLAYGFFCPVCSLVQTHKTLACHNLSPGTTGLPDSPVVLLMGCDRGDQRI